MKEIAISINSSTLRLNDNLGQIKDVVKNLVLGASIEPSFDNYSEMKDSRASINKIKKDLKDKIGEEIKAIEAPLLELKEKAKEIYAICDEGVALYSPHIRDIEDAGKLEHRTKMMEYLDLSILDLDIPSDIRDEGILLLPNPSIAGLTKTKGLVKKYKDSIDSITSSLLEKKKNREMEEKIKELEDEKRAEAIIAKREAAEITSNQVNPKVDNDYKLDTSEHIQSNSVVQEHSIPEMKIPVPDVSDGNSVYKVIRTVVEVRTILVKAKSGTNTDVIISKTNHINEYDEVSELSSITKCVEIIDG